MRERVSCLNSFILRMIAIVTMVIDHVGAVMHPGVMMYRYIGRIAFPIFVFLLVEGFVHTHNIRKYEINMLIFALVSEIPFDLAFHQSIWDFEGQNVFMTLFIGLVMLDLAKRFWNNRGLVLVILIIAIAVAELLNTDYSGFGVLLIFLFYLLRGRILPQAIVLFFIAYVGYGLVEVPSVIAMIPIILYNGKRGPSFGRKVLTDGSVKETIASLFMKYVFYVFYPVHLLVLAILAGNIGRI